MQPLMLNAFTEISLIGLILITILLGLGLWIRYHLMAKMSTIEQIIAQQTQQDGKLYKEIAEIQPSMVNKLHQLQNDLRQEQNIFKETIKTEFHNQRTNFDQHQITNLKLLQESLQNTFNLLGQQIQQTLNKHSEQIGVQVKELTQQTDMRLKEISLQVDKRLTEGFEKTNETFNQIIKRLALIDQAQQKLGELSTNMVSLQEILSDKTARGSFGEVQLSALVNNVLPANCVSLQHTLSNGKRVDCMLFLPEPSGNIAIDAKFPLENYRRAMQSDLSDNDRRLAQQQFRHDVRKHIQDISQKYIVHGETADGAMLFIPAEAVFAYIHSKHSDLVEYAQKHRVWLVSPTTMMAVLTSIRSVLKDFATREQVHIIRHHLSLLAKDFERFQKRMDSLEKHINQASQDVKEVNTSARKISEQFCRIDQAELTVELNYEPKILVES